MRRWLVDGTNVVGARPDGWWRDRPAAFARLVARLGLLVEEGDEVTVVFDGRPTDALAEGAHDGVMVVWATRRGPDAADDRIVDLVRADPDPRTRTVVTSDRALVARVVDHAAPVAGASTLLRVLDDAEAPR